MIEWLFNLRVFDWFCVLVEKMFGLAVVTLQDLRRGADRAGVKVERWTS